MHTADFINAGGSLAVLLTAWISWVKWAHPKWTARQAREKAKEFALLGGPVIDPLTGKTTSIQPPLGQWMGDINGSLQNLTDVLTAQSHQADQITDLQHRMSAVEDKLPPKVG